MGKVIIELERALQRLKLWDELEAVATEALILHEDYNRKHKLAQDYIFLAEVALEKKSYEVSKNLAQKGLDILLADVPVDEHWDAGLYYLFLAQAEKYLGDLETSLQYLLTAKDLGDLGHPKIYLRILKELRAIYLSQKDYLSAFEIKQLQLEVEHQYGLRSFIGAGYLKSRKQEDNPLNTDKSENIAVEIVNSGRSLDVARLLGRLVGNDSKLIVIHGFSGVGKSSLIRGGLIPALTKQMIGYHKNFPVYVRDYQNWVLELGRSLQNLLIESHLFDGNLENLPNILGQLGLSESRFLRTVLVFDQFEEFFFSNPEPLQRREFFSFLGNCLRLPDVRVVLSLREDYLHYLLECDRIENMQIFNDDILGKHIRYRLGNFSLADAQIVVENLTRGSRASFPADLIEVLVVDLGRKLGEVRPIELQIVGAQMQTENIKTLAEYREIGTLETLINRYLESVVNDCGAESEQVAEILLYILTDERGTRPRKTREELERDLKDIAQMIPTKEQLDLILTVFLGSGLVMLLPDVPLDRYQLVHDYLAELIRTQQEPRLKHLVEELEEEKLQRKLEEAKVQRLQKMIVWGTIIAISSFFTVLSIITSVLIFNKIKEKNILEIQILNKLSKTLYDSNQYFDALIQGLKAASKIHNANLTKEINIYPLGISINQVINQLYLYNILEGHTGPVKSVSFSPDGKTIVSGSSDTLVKLWDIQGKLLNTLIGHTDVVKEVSFSPDGETIASASSDKTVKLWNRQGKLLHTLIGHNKNVNSVSFSPDGETIASASSDKTVKLWNRQGKLLNTLIGHTNIVYSVIFSPDGKTIASASSDKTVKLWNRQGKLLHTLIGHTGIVNSVIFSPDSETIASGSGDKTVKLWNRQGNLLNTLNGHNGIVNGVSFSPDGETIASGSYDNTVKLWNRQGKLVQTLFSNNSNSRVTCVSFSPDGETIASGSWNDNIELWHRQVKLTNNLKGHTDFVTSIVFSLDSNTIATGSYDKTVKLSNRQGKLLHTLIGHTGNVNGVSFSPDGETIASGSDDKTVKLWNRQGKLLNTLYSHDDRVNSVSFSSDGKIIASGSYDKTIKLWNSQGQLLNTLYGHTGNVNSISFSQDGKTIASGSDDKSVKLWNRQGKLLNTLNGHNGIVNGVSFSPDGKIIVSGSDDKTVKLWNSQGKLLNTLIGHDDFINSVSFSQDGKTIASGSWDNTIRFWNQQGKLLNTLIGNPKDYITSVNFSPDGQIIAHTSLKDHIVILRDINLNNKKLQKKYCQYLHDYLITHPDSLTELTVCQNSSILKEASSSLITQGNNLARNGFTEDAIKKFSQVKKWDTKSTFDSKNQVKQIEDSQNFIKEGEELAKKLDIEGATAKFKQALKHDHEVIFDPDNQAKQIAFNELFFQGKQLAKNNSFQQAILKYQQADNIAKGVQIISANDWDSVCYNGSLANYAQDVIIACEKAVSFEPNNRSMRDSRGIARAMTGNIQGAIEDFEFYIAEINKLIQDANTDDDRKELLRKWRSQRQQWVNELKAGKNPFTPELRKKLLEGE